MGDEKDTSAILADSYSPFSNRECSAAKNEPDLYIKANRSYMSGGTINF